MTKVREVEPSTKSTRGRKLPRIHVPVDYGIGKAIVTRRLLRTKQGKLIEEGLLPPPPSSRNDDRTSSSNKVLKRGRKDGDCGDMDDRERQRNRRTSKGRREKSPEPDSKLTSDESEDHSRLSEDRKRRKNRRRSVNAKKVSLKAFKTRNSDFCFVYYHCCRFFRVFVPHLIREF